MYQKYSKALDSIRAHSDDSKDGLVRQYLLNMGSFSLAVGEVKGLEFSLLCTDPESPNLARLRLRLLTGEEYYDYPFNIVL